MQTKLSKENLTGLAHQAVNSLRRLVGSGGDSYTPAQQDLITSTKQIEERWRRRRMAVDPGTVEMWCSGLRDELLFQTSSHGRKEVTAAAAARKPLTESAMVSALETARILSRTTRLTAAESFFDYEILPLLVKYFMTVPLPKKVRDVCLLVLAEVPGDQSTLMAQCVEACLPFLVIDDQDTVAAAVAAGAREDLPSDPAGADKALSAGDVCEGSMETATGSELAPSGTSVAVDPRAVCLAALLVSAIHRADAVSTAEMVHRNVYPVDGAVQLFQCAHKLLMAPSVVSSGTGASAADAGDGSDNYRITVVVVYLSLISGFVRGSCEAKTRLTQQYRETLCQIWCAAASDLGHMDTVLSLPTPGKDTVTHLMSIQTWQSELLELLIELVTDDCFTLRRLSVYDTLEVNNSPISGGASGDGTPSSMTRSSSQPAGSPTGTASFGVRRFEPIPPHWDTILTGGSALVWRTASRLSACLIRQEAVGVLEQCLLSLDSSSVFAESMYRNIIATLMLLCVADPHNAQRLADNAMSECLVALVTNNQASVFPSKVRLAYDDESSFISVSPTGQLTTNTTQLTESFMCSLSAVYFSRKQVQMLMRGVELMSTGHTCQTDADIVESLLHVLSTTFTPPSVLFFPGCGSVVCKVDSFPGRWSGYSFSTWVNPVCVWAEGSHLFSFSGDAGATVTLILVANGRSCCLALRVQTAKEQALAVISESAIAAESWSHIVFTHGLSGVAVFVNGRKLPATNVSVPFPQVPSKHHRLDLSFGGALDEPSFYGYVACMDLLEEAVNERDVGKLFAIGPACSEAAGFRPLLSISAPVMLPPPKNVLTPVAVSGSLLKKREGVSLHGVVAFHTPDMQAVFAECGVMDWALKTLKASRNVANSAVIAKLCVSFIATAMRMTNSDAELNAVLGPPEARFLEALTAEVLAWDEVFLEFPSIMLSAATQRDGGKALRDLPSTQAIFTMLLERLEVVCGAREHSNGNNSGGGTSGQPPNSPNSLHSNTNAGVPNAFLSRNIMSACSILRELSDCLLVPENVRLFKSIPGRFDRILRMSLSLPPECIESVVVLLEKLCKCQPDLERTLRFLVQGTPGMTRKEMDEAAASASSLGGAWTAKETRPKGGAATATASIPVAVAPTSPNTSLASLTVTNAYVAKAEILRMLFDVARADAAMCDMIYGCFKGTGASFLVFLVHGKHHASEAVRVFALRLLSLMLHVNRKFHESFVKSHGFVVLSRVITDPRSRVPIRLPTVDCLFQMAFDGYRPTDGAGLETSSRLSSSTSQSALKSKPKKPKHHDTVGGGGLSRNLGMPGHLPGLVSRRLKVTRREYSFEVAHDFARVDDRLQFDDTYRSKSVHSVLNVPPAFETALAVLGSLIAAVGSQSSITAASVPENTSSAPAGAEEWDGCNAVSHTNTSSNDIADGDEGRHHHHSHHYYHHCHHHAPNALVVGEPEAFAAPFSGGSGGSGGGGGGSGGDGNSSVSGKSPLCEEESSEKVVARVLSYLEKVTDVEQNGVELLQYPWMDWLWGAVKPVAATRHGSAVTSPSSPVAPGRYTKKFSSMVMLHTRHIIRKLVALDMTRHSKAASIRRLRGIRQPAYLLRIVLEEVARHFTKGKPEAMSDPRGAGNVIKNLDTLFRNIEYTLDPLPLHLGTEIVNAISAIAVRNNSWVRMRMKKDSDLFNTRDRLAFFLLLSIKRFAKADTETLLQLVDANSNELGTTPVLLSRLSRAVEGKDLDEVETLLLLIQRLTTSYEDQLREVYKLLGTDGAQLSELLCVVHDDVATPSTRRTVSVSFSALSAANNGNSVGSSGTVTRGSASTAFGAGNSTGNSTSDFGYDGEPLSDGANGTPMLHSVGTGNPLADNGFGENDRLPISQVIEWCRSHSAQWSRIANECQQLVLKLKDTHLKANRDRAEKEQSAVAKTTRSHVENQEQRNTKVNQELSRIWDEVASELDNYEGGSDR